MCSSAGSNHVPNVVIMRNFRALVVACTMLLTSSRKYFLVVAVPLVVV